MENMTVVNIGHNTINYIQKCDYEYTPEEIPEEPTELECVSAAYDAKFFAKSIATLAKF